MTNREYVSRTGPLPVSALDKAFGLNVARHRVAAGMDQYTLAELLTQCSGWAWHQSLVSKIELGKRPVRISEAYALADVFDTSVDALSGHVQEEPKTQAFAQLSEVRRVIHQLRIRERQITNDLETNMKRKTA